MMADSIDSMSGSGRFSRVGHYGLALVIIDIIRSYGTFDCLVATTYATIARGYPTTKG